MSDKIAELRITAKAQNNILLSLIEKDYKSVKIFCDKNNLPYSSVCSIINLSKSSKKSKNKYRKVCYDIATALKVIPEIIFPETLDDIENQKIKKEVYIADLNLQDINILSLESPENIAIRNEKIKTIKKVIELMPEKEKEVIKMRFGIDCKKMTLKEVGKKLNVSGNRVRDIEANCLYRLRNPKYLNLLKEIK